MRRRPRSGLHGLRERHKTSRPELDRALDHLRAGDTLVVWTPDRPGRSLPHLVETLEGLADRDVSFPSVRDPVDTTTPGGRLVFHISAALAESERALIRERTQAGLATARARGRVVGRKPALNREQVPMARDLLAAAPSRTVPSVATTLGVGKSTLYRALQGKRP